MYYGGIFHVAVHQWPLYTQQQRDLNADYKRVSYVINLIDARPMDRY